jgi:hypothetical protein
MIADALPDSAIEYIEQHPRVIYLVTVPLLVFAAYNLEKAYRLQAAAEMFVRQRVSDAARAASEALGG